MLQSLLTFINFFIICVIQIQLSPWMIRHQIFASVSSTLRSKTVSKVSFKFISTITAKNDQEPLAVFVDDDVQLVRQKRQFGGGGFGGFRWVTFFQLSHFMIN